MAHCEYASPIGELTLVASDTGLQGVWWPEDVRAPDLGERDPDHPILLQATRRTR